MIDGILLSHERSGCHKTRCGLYMVEHGNLDDFIFDQYPVHHTHYSHSCHLACDRPIEDHGPVLLIIRNYKELKGKEIYFQSQPRGPTVPDISQIRFHVDNYAQLIELYDRIGTKNVPLNFTDTKVISQATQEFYNSHGHIQTGEGYSQHLSEKEADKLISRMRGHLSEEQFEYYLGRYS